VGARVFMETACVWAGWGRWGVSEDVSEGCKEAAVRAVAMDGVWRLAVCGAWSKGHRSFAGSWIVGISGSQPCHPFPFPIFFHTTFSSFVVLVRSSVCSARRQQAAGSKQTRGARPTNARLATRATGAAAFVRCVEMPRNAWKCPHRDRLCIGPSTILLQIQIQPSGRVSSRGSSSSPRGVEGAAPPTEGCIG
jgi:hypothetical protein